MDFETMYKGIPYSPSASLTSNITASATTINISNTSVFPEAPNIATIGDDENAETITYTGKTTTALTGCKRGVEGIAKAWNLGIPIARNYTSKDHDIFINNINYLELGKVRCPSDPNEGIYIGYDPDSSGLNYSWGSQSIGVGYKALQNQAGTSNIAIGWSSLEKSNMDSSNIIAIGQEAGKNIEYGEDNVIIGSKALGEGYYLSEPISHVYAKNIVIGSKSFSLSARAEQNIVIGVEALKYNYEGYKNIVIGNNALSRNSFSMNNTVIGHNTDITGDDQVQIGSSDQTVYGSSVYNVRSDERDKADIQPLLYDAYEFIKQLKPCNFRWDKREDYETSELISIEEYEEIKDNKDSHKYFEVVKLTDKEFKLLETEDKKIDFLLTINKNHKPKFKFVEDEDAYIAYLHNYRAKRDGSKKRRRFHNGFIAQEVKAITDKMGFDFAGLQDHKKNGGDDVYTLGYEQFIAPIVSSIQTLMEKTERLEKENEELKIKLSKISNL